MKLLLLSNSTMPGTPFFTWPRPHVSTFLMGTGSALFIPFAAVSLSYDEYEQAIGGVFASLGIQIQSIHRAEDPKSAIKNADAIVAGGGNTFALLHHMNRLNLIGTVREVVTKGVPYVGWSAGANLACPTIKTTNDMPVIEIPSFDALNLVPFQINPHYTNFKQPGHGGETRQQRLEEYLILNSIPVVGLPEGMLIERKGDELTLGGEGAATLFRKGYAPEVMAAGADLSHVV